MGGSGGRFFGREVNPEEIRRALRQEEERAKDQAFEVQVADAMAEVVSEYNRRNADAVATFLGQIKRALERNIEGSVDPMFGGSVRKHTFVDGISDIDSLLILKDEELRGMSPQEVLRYFEQAIRRNLTDCEVTRGQLAVTVSRGDLQIQLLPAVKEDETTKIPSASGDSWSKIQPEAFFRQLTRSNERCGGKVVPTIKLVKLVIQSFAEAARPTGYHIESLAVEAFRRYEGPFNIKAMLRRFFEDSVSRVLMPITDRTGQSVYVDEYLGPANSQKRKLVSQALNRVVRQMKNADASRSQEQWLRIVGEA